MHRILIVLGLSFALVSCGGDDAGDGDNSSHYQQPSAPSVVTASGAIGTPADITDVVIAGRPTA